MTRYWCSSSWNSNSTSISAAPAWISSSTERARARPHRAQVIASSSADLPWPLSPVSTAPATARPLAAGALERRDVVRALELGANVLVVQLTRPFRRYFDPHPHDGVGEPIRLASDRPHHVLGGVITFYFRLNG